MRRKKYKPIFSLLTPEATVICYKTGKTVYTKKEARTVINHRRKRGVGYLREYHCKYCNLWHVTHQPKWQDVVYYPRTRMARFSVN